ncbi:DUF6128 domain-containing protein [uncultured Clostridium sp.]|uniref:DUF6128 domain-containing protein n=1 Tax=uncultured Clostridium sp. TaxID=59620 RepID=UPI0025D29562|nr:DUF6128 domain-containing protein [uncultured Clostridium sp.]
MSAYHRLISYIYAYEGGIKGKNTGFAKLETRGTSCRIQVSVRRVFAGGSPIGVYLLAGQDEIRIGTLFVRGGNGEFRTVVNCENIEGSGCNMEECCGLTLHETDSAWRAYTTIWEDAVAHAAEVELADVTAEKVREQEAEKEEATRKQTEKAQEAEKEEAARKPAENVSGEVDGASVGKEKLDEVSELAWSGEMESQDTSTETEKKEVANINEADFGISQPQPEQPEDSNLEIFEDTETMEAVPDIPETSDHQEAEIVQEAQTETPQEPFQPGSQNQKQPQPDSSKESPKEDPAETLWNRLRVTYPKVTAFECSDGCEILVIKPQDIGLLPRENWVYGNNSFLLHGYYNYRYLILARLGKSGERGRYILGVPGHYGNNEKYMAAMFGFDRFVRSTRQPPRDSRFGYWYTDLNFT